MTRFCVLLSMAGLAVLPATSLAQWDDNLLKPFVMNHRAATTSPADVSFLLDAPPRKNGFIRVVDGHLVNGMS
jgi:hypothetical protein